MNRVLSAVVFALVWASAGPALAATKPNILFIMVDEMKWNVMSCAGHPIVKTPHLDRLAREGTRFETAYTVAPICTPSRYSFFTGRYAHVHGATDNNTPPREPQLLLPSILKHHGYQTAISGKLHFIPNNRDYGFDYFWSFAGEGPGRLPSWPQDIEKKHGRDAARRLEVRPFPDDPLGRDLGKLGYPKEDAQTFWIPTAPSIFSASATRPGRFSCSSVTSIRTAPRTCANPTGKCSTPTGCRCRQPSRRIPPGRRKPPRTATTSTTRRSCRR